MGSRKTPGVCACGNKTRSNGIVNGKRTYKSRFATCQGCYTKGDCCELCGRGGSCTLLTLMKGFAVSEDEGIKCSLCEWILREVDEVGELIGLSPDVLEPVPLPSDGLCPRCRSHWKGKNATPESPYLKLVNPKQLILRWNGIRREVARGTHEGLVEAVKDLDEYMMSTYLRRHLDTFQTRMNVQAVIAALGTQFDPDEARIIDRMLRELDGTVPDQQMVEEIGLALAIHRRQRQGRGSDSSGT